MDTDWVPYRSALKGTRCPVGSHYVLQWTLVGQPDRSLGPKWEHAWTFFRDHCDTQLVTLTFYNRGHDWHIECLQLDLRWALMFKKLYNDHMFYNLFCKGVDTVCWNTLFWELYMYSGTPLNRPLMGLRSNGLFSGVVFLEGFQAYG